MYGSCFQVGDRVRVRADINFMRVAMLGTIVQILLPEDDIYDVEFEDGYPRLMLGRELERFDDVGEALIERQIGE
jgi:hypothetical protein